LGIVGFVVLIAGGAFYKTSEDYLLASFERDKLAQIISMSALIDADYHQKIKSRSSLNKQRAQHLAGVFEIAASSDEFQHDIFSLNYLSKKKQFKYAIDNRKAKKDTIVLSASGIELEIIKNKNGEVKLSRFGKQSDKLDINKQSTQLTFLLNKHNNQTFLYLNGRKLLELKNQKKLVALVDGALLDEKNNTKKIIFDLIKTKLTLSFSFVKQGNKLHHPGERFLTGLALHKKMLDVMTNDISADNYHVIDNQAENGFYVFSSIKNAASNSSGLLMMQVNNKTISQLKEQAFQAMLVNIGLLVAALMAAAIFFARKITEPVEQLNLAIARLIHNDFNFKLSAKKFGSFSFLANQFNLMLTRIQKSRNELVHLNKSYSRFVPHQLLKQLSHSGVSDITLGDSTERLMTIMFCDIRGFTSLSESMSPTANFKFINRYLSQIAPVINKHGGIIDKYLGDGIMALFPNGADEALQASIEMLEALKVYNKKLVQNKLPIIEVGIGLHSGKTMLGTVGTPSRMDATVISDSVNAAARVEALTKSFCTKILITEETKRQLSQLANYRIRYIASCQIQGKSKPVTLYEVFDNDPLSLQKEKLQNQATMIRAWKAYKNGDTETAVNMYQKLLEKNSNDKSLFALIERCQSGRL